METVQTIVDIGVGLAQQNPKAAAAVGGLSALYAALQAIGFALSRIFPANTQAAKIGTRIAAFPVKLAAPPVADLGGNG